MNFLLSIIPTVAVLGILIVIHEFGHFLACRLTGVKVEKFSIGFGPEIFHWQSRETRYVISLFPLGGFVKPAGESLSDIQGDQGPRTGDYLAAPLWARIVIVSAGVIMNYVLAYGLFVGIFMIGRPLVGTTLAKFVEGYPAQTSGLVVGDKILEVNGLEVRNWGELTQALNEAPDGVLGIKVERMGEPLNFEIVPKTEEVQDIFGKPMRVKRLGITPDPQAHEFERYSFTQSLKHAWETEVFLTTMTYKGIYFLLLGKASLKMMSGPIGIISMTGDAARLGLPYLLQLTATLSVSLAVINLLPVPALDGGHLLFLLIEAVRRKSVSLAVQERATQVGFFLLLGLMGFILYNDMVNLDILTKFGRLLERF